MSHPDWCGKPCSGCETVCDLDNSITCSPDCPDLDPITGEPLGDYCKECDAINNDL